MRKIRVLTEKKLESIIAKKAIDLGYLTFKFTSPSNRGVPDRIFINKNGETFYIEFKSPSGRVTTLQKTIFLKFIARNTYIYVVNDIQKGISILENNQKKIKDNSTFGSLYESKIIT